MKDAPFWESLLVDKQPTFYDRSLIMTTVVRPQRMSKVENIWPDLFIEETDGRYTWKTRNLSK